MRNKTLDTTFHVDYFYTISNKSQVRSTETGLALDILLPGFTKDEISVKLEGDTLLVKANTERKLPSYIYPNVEKGYTIYDIDAKSIVAKLEHGILTIEYTTAKKAAAKSIKVI